MTVWNTHLPSCRDSRSGVGCWLAILRPASYNIYKCREGLGLGGQEYDMSTLTTKGKLKNSERGCLFQFLLGRRLYLGLGLGQAGSWSPLDWVFAALGQNVLRRLNPLSIWGIRSTGVGPLR